MIVKKCGGCDQLFEVEAGHPSDTIRKSGGFVRTAEIDICPICRAAAIERGKEPLPAIPPDESETPAAAPEAEPEEEPRAE